MKYLGIDYGTKTLGIAVSDRDGKIAFPRPSLPNDINVVQSVVDLMKGEGAVAVVIGDTRAINGGENTVTKEADDFASSLEAAGVRVERIWEAWSSVEAARFAPKGKTHDDSAAAAIILQRFLDRHGGGTVRE